MAVYLVSYDLNRRKDYTRLITRIKQSKAYSQVLYSQWLVQSDQGSKQVRDDLVRYMDADDAVLVAEMSKTVAWRSLMIDDKAMQQWVDLARSC